MSAARTIGAKIRVRRLLGAGVASLLSAAFGACTPVHVFRAPLAFEKVVHLCVRRVDWQGGGDYWVYTPPGFDAFIDVVGDHYDDYPRTTVTSYRPGSSGFVTLNSIPGSRCLLPISESDVAPDRNDEATTLPVRFAQPGEWADGQLFIFFSEVSHISVSDAQYQSFITSGLASCPMIATVIVTDATKPYIAELTHAGPSDIPGKYFAAQKFPDHCQ